MRDHHEVVQVSLDQLGFVFGPDWPDAVEENDSGALSVGNGPIAPEGELYLVRVA